MFEVNAPSSSESVKERDPTSGGSLPKLLQPLEAGLGWTQKPGALSSSPKWIAAAPTFRSSSSAFLKQ